MSDFLIVGIAGFSGAILRHSFYLAERAFIGSHFPVATLIINVLGCLLSGIIVGLQTKFNPQSSHLLQLISIGFIGSLTTFSAFSAETIKLLENNFHFQAILNIFLNLILGFSVFILGRMAFKL